MKKALRCISNLLIFAVVVSLTIPGVALAQEIPPLPAAYYGSVKDANGQGVASGKVEAYIEGRKAGEIDFTNGLYGGSGGLDPKLVVSGTEADRGKTVSFKVVTVGQTFDAAANPAVVWQPGDVRRVDLTVGEVSEIQDTTSPSAPANLRVTAKSSSTVTLAWDPSTDNMDVAKYIVEMRTSSAEYQQVGETQTTSFSKSGLSPSTTYSFRVKAIDTAGNSSLWSNEVSVTTEAASIDGGVVRPYVFGTDPADKGTGVPVDKEIKVLFSKRVAAGDDFGKITLKDASGNAVEVDVRIDGSALYIKPKAALAYGTTYTVVIPAGAVQDSYGYRLGSDYTFVFTTVSEQPKPPEEQPKPRFKDMVGHWAEGTVARLADMGVISGYPDGTFKPDNDISRAEVTAILVRALKLPAGSEQDLKFKDNASIPDWARGVVAAAAREGLVRGYPQPDGTVTFEPDRPVSRAEMAALMVRILEKKIGPVVPAELRFADAGNIPDWVRPSVGAAVAKGIVVGYPDNTFRSDKRVTRAEAAAMILRLLDAIGSK